MRARFNVLLLPLALFGLVACGPQAGPDEDRSAGPETVPGIDAADVPPPPTAPDTVRRQ